jgi:arginine decarboxylase
VKSIREKNRQIFRPHLWGKSHFDIDEQGRTVVKLAKGNIPFVSIIEKIKKSGFSLPAVVRFPELITHQSKKITCAFQNAINDFSYQGDFTGVYPLKVNPMSPVVNTFITDTSFGLEAGSKAELIEAMSLALPKNRLVLVNGHKDRSMFTAIFEAARLDYPIIPIIEKFNEIFLFEELAKKMQVAPKIGVRVRLHAKGSGRWEASTGERAKFGLNTHDILTLLERLRQNDSLKYWEMLHFHIGSQVTNIRHIENALKEASRIFCHLWKMGVPLKYMDIGGGLGVDYDGSRSDTDSSINYSIKEYANNVVYTLGGICREEGVPEPGIICESGRILVAKHAVLLLESLGRNRVSHLPLPGKIKKEHDLIKDLRTCYREIKKSNVHELLHDARSLKEDGLKLYDLGYLSLNERHALEALYWKVLEKSKNHLVGKEKEICKVELADQLILNFSLFQSLPDYWAVDHNFPVMPLEGLNFPCDEEITLADITCDSDGKITSFIHADGEERKTLPFHKKKGEKPDILGVFLIGAYQDILGDLHNLFGPLNEVKVTWPARRKHFHLEKLDPGSNISETLQLMHLAPEKLVADLISNFQKKSPNLREKKRLEKFFKKILRETTYFKN